MIGRLSLTRRVGLIVLIGFLASWLAILTGSFLALGLRDAAALPSPARLEALARLIEQTPPELRREIVLSVNSPLFEVQLPPVPPPAETPMRLRRSDAKVVRSYYDALPDRPLLVLPRTGFRPGLSALNTVEFQLGLAEGETLVVRTRSPFQVAPPGMPVGFGAGLLGIGIALIALIMLNREFRPLSRLAMAVDKVGVSGELSELPPMRPRSPEIRALVHAFERLQGRIATLIRARMALVGGIQHDLRSFATRLRLRIDKIGDPDERARAATDIDHMIALLDDALLASRAGASELDEELVDIAPILASETADRQRSGHAVALNAAADARHATVLGDRLALRRIFANLIDNALKYGHSAKVALYVERPDIVVTVDDDGPGIPAERRQLLLEPFTRLEPSRARTTGGSGLGLAVVKSLVSGHGGRVSIDDAPGHGARLTVRLPIFEP
ncbi:MAG: ATP-binding protein [Pseudomonadota bacterium]